MRPSGEPHPPRLLQRLVAAVAPPDLQADLAERYALRRRTAGLESAYAWYARQAISCAVHARDLQPFTVRGGARTPWRMARGLVHDVREVARSLSRAPAFALGTIAVLALGLGASTLVFAVTNWVLLRPLPGVTDPQHLVSVWLVSASTDADGAGGAVYAVSNPLVRDLGDGVAGVTGIAAYTGTELHLALRGVGEPRTLAAQITTGNFFDVLGMSMRLGRGFTDAEGRDPGAAQVAVISSRLWRQALGADPGAIGREIEVNGRPFRIVGIAPTGFLGPDLPGDTDAWIPVAAHRIVMPYAPPGMLDEYRSTVFFHMLARLAPGVSSEAASERIAARYSALLAATPELGNLRKLRPVIREDVGLMPSLRRDLRRTLAVLLAVVGFLLLVTCANFANLLLAHGLRRRHEDAVRAALGASRGRIVRQHVLAATALAVAGGVVGMGAASWALGLFRATRLAGWTAPLGTVRLDVRVLGFALGAAVISGIAFGALPALGLTRPGPATALQGTTPTTRGGRLRGPLTALQLAVSFALLTAALVSTGALARMRAVDLGFDPRGVAVFGLRPDLQGTAGEDLHAEYRALLDGLRSVPGVTASGLAAITPYGRVLSQMPVRAAGADAADAGPVAASNMVSTGFFASLGLRFIEGRDFDPEEIFEEGEPQPVILSESLARELFPDGPAVGREVTVGWQEVAPATVVGVVSDARLVNAGEPAGPAVFQTLGRAWMPGNVTVLVRSMLPATTVLDRARDLVRDLDPGLPLHDPSTLTARLETRRSQPILVARLSGLFATIAALLSGVGLYGVLSALVAESRRELGVRSALGAPAARLRRLVLARGVRASVAGLGGGLVLAWMLSRGLAAVLPGVQPLDPSHWVGAAALLLGVVMTASLRPALRAGRLDPVEVLRGN